MTATITTEFLMICHYCCMSLIAGADEFSDEDAAQVTAKADAMASTYPNAVIVLNSADSIEFSDRPCQTCNESRPGDRYPAEAAQI